MLNRWNLKKWKEVKELENEETNLYKELLGIFYVMSDNLSLIESHLGEMVKKLSGIELNTKNIV